MRKLIALFMAALLLLALVGCASDNEATEAPKTEATTEATTEAPEPVVTVDDPLEILNNVWAGYTDEEKFPAAGGDFSEENSNMEGPGRFSLEDLETLEYLLLMPADTAAMVDDAASLTHMMNANTFTCGAFHVTNAADVDAVVAALKDKITTNQWMCGFPDDLYIITIDNCVISVFGNAELTANFVAKTQSAYENAVIACNEPLI